MIGLAARAGQRLPQGIRAWVLRSPAAPPLRWLLNRLVRERNRLVIVPVGGPLAGHRMMLDWKTHKAFVFGVYERDVVHAIRTTVQPGSLVADVGAHIGYHTLVLRKMVGPNGRVVAFEPWPDVAAVLRRNCTLNGYSDIVVNQVAVGDRTGFLIMTRTDDDPLTSTSRVALNGGISVPMVALDDYFSPAEPLAFAKVDVEGAEISVLRGMRRILTEHRPGLVVAVHGYRPGHEVEQLLASHGYRTRVVDAWGAEHHILATPR